MGPMKQLRTSRVPIMLTEEERELFTAAAEDSGLTLSAWLRLAAREKAAREGARAKARKR